MLTLELMKSLWPNGNSKVPGLIEGMVNDATRVFARYGLDSPLVVAHAMAQFSHECGAGTEVTENINYTAERACEVWPTRFNSADDCYRKVGSYAGDPQFHIRLMDSVYGGRMGNRLGTHDGSTYIGRGAAQTTGREAYGKIGSLLGMDFTNKPELVNDPRYFLEVGCVDFALICHCIDPARGDNIREVTHRLNGGYIGLPERVTWLAKWKRALGVPAGNDVPHAEAPAVASSSNPTSDPMPG